MAELAFVPSTPDQNLALRASRRSVARDAGDFVRRITYFMLLRVAVATLLLVVAVLTEITSSASSVTVASMLLFALIAGTYALTLVWAALVKRRRGLTWMPSAQVTADLFVITSVVYLTGGPESGFVFLYLLLIVAAASVLSRRSLVIVTAGVYAAYLVISIGTTLGLIPPFPGEPPFDGLSRAVVRTFTMNLIAIAATAALARRLANEIERAGEDIAAQVTRLEDLAVVHEAVVRSLPSGLVTIGNDGRVESCNHAAEEILGVSSDAVAGRLVQEVLPSLPSLPGVEALRRAQLRFVRPDGAERVIGLSLSPLHTSSGEIVGRVMNFQDLTELERMRERVSRSERLAAIGRLVAGIAHEIRNPLAAISGAVEMLRMPIGTSDDRRELMTIVTREIDRLNRLITDLLDFARPSQPEPSRIEVGCMLKELGRVFESDQRIGRGRIVLELDAPVWVDADQGQLRQVLWNLVLNAAQASPQGAPIVLGAAAIDAADGRWGRITVRDRGPGIPPPAAVRLFEPFFSTKAGGTGLGLATVHRIVEEHHGRIEVDNPEGGGARFAVFLPLREPPA